MAEQAVQFSIGWPPAWLANWVTYWRKFRGKHVRVITTKTHVTTLSGVTGTRYWRRVYEGTIDGIFDNPPGIMLSSVQVWSATETYVLDPDGNEHFFPLTLIEPAFGNRPILAMPTLPTFL